MNPQVFSVVPEFLSSDQCDYICELADMLKDQWSQGAVGGRDEPGHFDDIRQCKTLFFQEKEEEWEKLGLHDELQDMYQYIDMQFNTALEKMGLGHIHLSDREDFQYTHYDDNGENYNWHKDMHHEPYSEGAGRWEGLVRKMSMTVFLNDFSEYEGGMLELENPLWYGPNDQHYRINTFTPDWMADIKKGSAIIFQSSLMHRVTPVTKGVRKSLVAWYLGYPWT